MPNKRTFLIPPIRRLIERETWGLSTVLDLFPFPFEKDALETLRLTKDDSIDCVLFDPPYSFNQHNTCYDGKGNLLTDTYRKDVKDGIRRVVKVGGICISFGWNTNGLGVRRGFEITKILIVAHGGSHNDTLVTVERKFQEKLTP